MWRILLSEPSSFPAIIVIAVNYIFILIPPADAGFLLLAAVCWCDYASFPLQKKRLTVLKTLQKVCFPGLQNAWNCIDLPLKQ